MVVKNEENAVKHNTPFKDKAEYRKYLIVAIVMLAIVFGAGIKYAHFIDGSQNKGLPAPAIAENITVLSSAEAKIEGKLAISLNGAVLKQGYYAVPEGTFLGELLDYVGLSENADTSLLNYAQMLKDGDRVIVPLLFVPETLEEQTATDENNKTDDTDSASAHQTTSYTGNTPEKITEASGIKININTATVSQLMQLPNIGEKRAAAIIDYRKQNGTFASIANIKDVSGIGEKTYEKIKGLICVE